MAFSKEQYQSITTSQSKTELTKFANWMKKNHKKWPTVIGGWAVWAYYPKGFGSRDVDLVLPSDKWINDNMYKDYFKNNDFQKYQGLNQYWIETHYGKPIDPKKSHLDVVYFDLMSCSFPRDDPEEIGVHVDWNWANKFGNEIEFNKKTKIIVPELELLVTLKMIGALARTRSYLLVKDRTYLTGKIWKDYVDIANLASNLTLDKKKLEIHYKNSKLTKLLWQEFLDGYLSQTIALEETKANIPDLTDVLKIDWKKIKIKK